jgi:predicted small secreted protein
MELSGLPRRLIKVRPEPAALCIEENTMTIHRFRALLYLALTLAPLGLVACNTTEGVGKDVKSAGNAIEDTANDAKDDMNN